MPTILFGRMASQSGIRFESRFKHSAQVLFGCLQAHLCMQCH